MCGNIKMQKEPTTQITIYTYNIQYKLHLKKYKYILIKSKNGKNKLQLMQ